MKLFTIHPGASFSTADVYNGMVRGLERLGVEVLRYNLDGRIYQSGAWLNWCWKQAKKAGVKMDKPTTGDVLYHACGDVILKALHHECEWVVIFSGMYFPTYFVKALKRAGLKVAVILTESPYDDEKQAAFISHCDVAWTHERVSLETLRLANPNVFYLPHAYDAEIHKFMAVASDQPVSSHDVVFVGTGFRERIETLSAVDWNGIDIGIYGSWVLVGSRSKLRPFIRSTEIENAVAASLYRRANIGLNMYRESKGFGRFAPKIEKAESMNLRGYELAACGLFHISSYRAEVEEIFGDLVPTYDDARDLEDKIRAYLADPAERDRVARLLPEKVKGHTWDDRAKSFMNDLGRFIAGQPQEEMFRLRGRPFRKEQATNG